MPGVRSQPSSVRLGVVVLSLTALSALSCSEGVLGPVNHMPVMLGVSWSPLRIVAGRDVLLRAEATDEDGDGIRYFWSSEAGTFGDIVGEFVTWTAPTAEGVYEILVNASDRRSSTATRFRVRVYASRLGAGDGPP